MDISLTDVSDFEKLTTSEVVSAEAIDDFPPWGLRRPTNTTGNCTKAKNLN